MAKEKNDQPLTLQAISDLIDKKFDSFACMVNKEFTYMHSEFDYMHSEFDYMYRKFDDIDKRFKGIDERFNSVDERFNSVDERLQSIKADINCTFIEIELIKQELRQERKRTVEDIDLTLGRVSTLEEDLKAMKSDLNKMKLRVCN